MTMMSDHEESPKLRKKKAKAMKKVRKVLKKSNGTFKRKNLSMINKFKFSELLHFLLQEIKSYVNHFK